MLFFVSLKWQQKACDARPHGNFVLISYQKFFLFLLGQGSFLDYILGEINFQTKKTKMYAFVQFLVDKVKAVVPVTDIKDFVYSNSNEVDISRPYEVFWKSPNGEGTGYWYAVILLIAGKLIFFYFILIKI